MRNLELGTETETHGGRCIHTPYKTDVPSCMLTDLAPSVGRERRHRIVASIHVRAVASQETTVKTALHGNGKTGRTRLVP